MGDKFLLIRKQKQIKVIKGNLIQNKNQTQVFHLSFGSGSPKTSKYAIKKPSHTNIDKQTTTQ